MNARHGTVCKIGELLGEPREYLLVSGREAPAFFAVDGERPLVDGRRQGGRHEGLDILVPAVIAENERVFVELIDAQRLVVLQNPTHEALAHIDRSIREDVGAQAVVCGELVGLAAFVFKEQAGGVSFRDVADERDEGEKVSFQVRHYWHPTGRIGMFRNIPSARILFQVIFSLANITCCIYLLYIK